MLNKEDESFITYWTANRLRERNSFRPFLVGLSIGLVIGLSIVLVLESGWYERANMVANSMLSSVVLVMAILILSVCMAYLYRKFRWEMQEQRWLELLAAKKKLENQAAKQA